MRNVDLAFGLTLALTLGTTQCNRAPEADEAVVRPTAVAASAPSAEPARAPADVGPAVRVPIDGLPMLGSASALVTVVAFTDYECPYCAKAERTPEGSAQTGSQGTPRRLAQSNRLRS